MNWKHHKKLNLCFFKLHSVYLGYGSHDTTQIFGCFPFNPKFRKFRLVHQMERTISVWFDRNIRDQLWRWSTLTGLVISVGRTGMSLSIWQNCCSQSRFFVSWFHYKNNKQTRGCLGLVCATGMYRSIGHVKFPKFQTGIFVEWKAPAFREVHVCSG